MNIDCGLVVCGRGKDFCGLGRYRRVALNQFREDSAQRLDTQRQRSDIQKYDVFDFTGQYSCLNGRSHSHHFVRIHTLVRVLAYELTNGFLNGRNTSRAADQNHTVNVMGFQPRVSQGPLGWSHGGLNQVFRQGLELGPRQSDIHIQRTIRFHGDERQVDRGLCDSGQLYLGLLSCFLHPLHSHTIFSKINTGGLLELANQIVYDSLIEVIAAQAVVPAGRLDFVNSVAEFQNGNVKRSPAKVKYQDGMIFVPLCTVGESRSGRLVDNTQDLKTGNGARILGGLPLSIREVGGNCDHGFRDLFSQVLFRIRPKLLQDHGRDFRRSIIATVYANLVLGTHLPFDRQNRAIRVADRLSLGHRTNKAFRRLTAVFLTEGYHRRCRPATLSVGDNRRFPAFHDRDNRIGGA